MDEKPACLKSYSIKQLKASRAIDPVFVQKAEQLAGTQQLRGG